MWHEARKQERIIRGLIVDYRRRAERRRDFYEKIKADPTQFLQIHGRQCKIHLDPAIAAAGESPAIMMPWQGDQQTSIDRFDVRAHLDAHDIPDLKRPNNEEISHEERYCNYERYRILAQNAFLGVDEEKFLHQLSIEEQFGVTMEEKEYQKEKAAEKKNASGVAIGYNYDDSSQPYYEQTTMTHKDGKPKLNDEDSDEESDLEIIDVDLSIDVNKVETSQAHAMNTYGTKYGMLENDLFSFLTGDAEEAEKQKQILREEKEKALFSGRKSRRERRAHRDKKLALRIVSPPHYAAKPSPAPDSIERPTPSPTHSMSPEPASNAITFITSFGGEDDLPEKITYADKVKSSEKTYASVVRDGSRRTYTRSVSPDLPYSKKRKQSSPSSKSYSKSRRSRSRSRSLKSKSKSKRSRSRSRSRKSRSRSSSKRTKSRSRSKKSRSRSRSRRSRSRTSVKTKSTWSKSRYTPSRSRSRSISCKRKRSISDRSSSRDSSRRRSYSRSYSRSRSSRSSSRTSDSSDNARRGNRKSNHSYEKSTNIGNSYNTDSNTGPVNRLPRYYGRKREGYRSSSSELSLNSDDDKSNTTDKMNDNMAGRISSQISNVVRSSGASPKRTKPSSEKLSLKEKLRRKTQAQLTRQLRADKKAEAERLEREQQLLQERDDEMRELAIKIRRRQREIRHQRRTSHSSEDRSSTSSKQCDKSSDSDSDDRSPNREEKKIEKRFEKQDKPLSSYDIQDSKSYDDRKSDSKSRDGSHRGGKYGSDKKYDKSYGSHHSSRSSRSPQRKRDRYSDDDYSNTPVKPLVDY